MFHSEVMNESSSSSVSALPALGNEFLKFLEMFCWWSSNLCMCHSFPRAVFMTWRRTAAHSFAHCSHVEYFNDVFTNFLWFVCTLYCCLWRSQTSLGLNYLLHLCSEDEMRSNVGRIFLQHLVLCVQYARKSKGCVTFDVISFMCGESLALFM